MTSLQQGEKTSGTCFPYMRGSVPWSPIPAGRCPRGSTLAGRAVTGGVGSSGTPASLGSVTRITHTFKCSSSLGLGGKVTQTEARSGSSPQQCRAPSRRHHAVEEGRPPVPRGSDATCPRLVPTHWVQQLSDVSAQRWCHGPTGLLWADVRLQQQQGPRSSPGTAEGRLEKRRLGGRGWP